MGFVSLTILVSIALASPSMGGSDEWGVRFTRIAFNPEGEDDGSNRSLRAEYIIVLNDTNARKNVGGWTIRDLGGGHVYEIPEGTVLGPTDRFILHTGRGKPLTLQCIDGGCKHNTDRHEFWGLDHYVWDNDRDRARLVRPDGSRADRCGYGIEARSPKRC